MGRPPSPKKKRQIPIALPSDLRSSLQDRATAGGHSLAEEIRRRLERSLIVDQCDHPTRELVVDIAQIAMEVERETSAPWHQDAAAHATMRSAVLAAVARRALKRGDNILNPPALAPPSLRPGATLGGTSPHDIGMWIEHRVWEQRDWTPEARANFRRGMEETMREILRTHEQQNDGETS